MKKFFGLVKKALSVLAKKVLSVLKKHWWYIFLLLISTVYVWKYRYHIYQLTELNAQNLT